MYIRFETRTHLNLQNIMPSSQTQTLPTGYCSTRHTYKHIDFLNRHARRPESWAITWSGRTSAISSVRIMRRRPWYHLDQRLCQIIHYNYWSFKVCRVEARRLVIVQSLCNLLMWVCRCTLPIVHEVLHVFMCSPVVKPWISIYRQILPCFALAYLVMSLRSLW